jgi:hypothetical protein
MASYCFNFSERYSRDEASFAISSDDTVLCKFLSLCFAQKPAGRSSKCWQFQHNLLISSIWVVETRNFLVNCGLSLGKCRSIPRVFTRDDEVSQHNGKFYLQSVEQRGSRSSSLQISMANSNISHAAQTSPGVHSQRKLKLDSRQRLISLHFHSFFVLRTKRQSLWLKQQVTYGKCFLGRMENYFFLSSPIALLSLRRYMNRKLLKKQTWQLIE